VAATLGGGPTFSPAEAGFLTAGRARQPGREAPAGGHPLLEFERKRQQVAAEVTAPPASAAPSLEDLLPA
jgi:hypothetical protein